MGLLMLLLCEICCRVFFGETVGFWLCTASGVGGLVYHSRGVGAAQMFAWHKGMRIIGVDVQHMF